jgi:hypothetical protein
LCRHTGTAAREALDLSLKRNDFLVGHGRHLKNRNGPDLVGRNRCLLHEIRKKDAPGEGESQPEAFRQ